MRDVQQLRYTATHEWVFAEAVTPVFTVGLSEHGQYLLGDIVHVSLPRIGQPFDAGQTCAMLETAKSAVDVHMPFCGMITAINETLLNEPGLINQQPFDDGWLFQFRAVLAADHQQLMDFTAYEAMLDA